MLRQLWPLTLCWCVNQWSECREMGVWGVSGSNGRSLCAGVSAGWVGECGGSLAAMAAHSVLE